MHYYSFNIGDYARDTIHLSELEDLAYRRIMDLYYSRELPLPNDIEEISRLIRMRTHCECIAIVLKDFFTLESDGYRQLRIDTEIHAYKEKSVKASKSAKARWKKVKAKQKVKEPCEGNANALKTQCEGNAKQEPLTTNHEPINNSIKDTVKAGGLVLELFNYWVDVMKKAHSTTKLTPKREKAIKARLQDGYTEFNIKAAIMNCKNDPFSMGQNDRKKKFNDIELICRTGEKLESFIDQGVIDGSYQQVNQPRVSTVEQSLRVGAAYKQQLENEREARRCNDQPLGLSDS